MIEMKVRGIAFDANLKIPMVVLSDAEEKRYLPICVGASEATAIFLQLKEQTVTRPMTHDLLKNIIGVLGAKVSKVLVSDIDQSTFFARIFLERPGTDEKYELDSRSSDAIALALRTDSPIFVAEKVVVKETIADKVKYQKEMSEFKKALKHISPADFNFPGNYKS